MNSLYVGFSREVELPRGGFLLIDDKVPDVPRARVFDPSTHCFNPLEGIDYKKARMMAEALYAIYPQGENTLTVRNGRRELLQALAKGKRLDTLEGGEEVENMKADLLASPVLSRVLCNPTNFSFNPRSVILAKVNRAELGEFDALALGLLLMLRFGGQVVVPDFGFYGREIHTTLVREERLIAGVNFLGELPTRLRAAVLLMREKKASGATYEDACELARYARLQPQTNAFNDFVTGAMG